MMGALVFKLRRERELLCGLGRLGR
jgi:hypothetical protein